MWCAKSSGSEQNISAEQFLQQNLWLGGRCWNFTTVDTSVTMKEGDWNVVGIFKTDVSVEEAPRLYCMASTLDWFGKPTNRRKKVGGSSMVMFGYFEFGQLGWAMARFEKILSNEGLPSGEGKFANTRITCFSITKDYKCWPHDDPSDYGYGIIVWLYSNEGIDIEDFPTIWLPQYHIRFSPRSGTDVVLNCNNTVHSTSRKKCVGTLTMAFVMKCNFITQLKNVLEKAQSKLTVNFYKAKAKYEEEKVITLLQKYYFKARRY